MAKIQIRMTETILREDDELMRQMPTPAQARKQGFQGLSFLQIADWAVRFERERQRQQSLQKEEGKEERGNTENGETIKDNQAGDASISVGNG